MSRSKVTARFQVTIPRDVREAAEIYDEFGISPHDCTHAAIMKRYGLDEIISPDKEFEKIAWIKRLDPRISG